MIDYGSGGRVGLVLPSANQAAEPEFRAMLPREVALHTTRVKLTSSAETELHAMARDVGPAAALLADARVDIVVVHCTALTTYGPELDQSVRELAERASGRPAVTTAQALLSALGELQARRVVLLSPYVEAVNEREARFVQSSGVDVLDVAGLGKSDAPSMMAVTPEEWLRFALAHAHPDADAYVISCTTVRALQAVEAMEREFRRPVITSNSATAWHCLRRLGRADRIAGFGALLREY